MHTRRSPRARLTFALGALLLALVAPHPASATTTLPATSAWLAPGVPITYEHADPSVTDFGPMLFSYGTNHGGADLPVLWSGDATTWTARAQYEGADAFRDGDRYGYFNDAFPSVPWGIDFNSCDASTPGCDPKELWAPSVRFIGRLDPAVVATVLGHANAAFTLSRYVGVRGDLSTTVTAATDDW